MPQYLGDAVEQFLNLDSRDELPRLLKELAQPLDGQFDKALAVWCFGRSIWRGVFRV